MMSIPTDVAADSASANTAPELNRAFITANDAAAHLHGSLKVGETLNMLASF